MPSIWKDGADKPLTFGRNSLQPPPGGDFALCPKIETHPKMDAPG